MRIVVDTNVLVSALLWQGLPHRLLEHARNGEATLFSSPALLTELADVLDRAKFNAALTHARITPDEILEALQRLSEVIEPAVLPEPVCRDPDDDHVIACALSASANAIVSGDRDLLELGSYQDIAILTVREALGRIV